MNEQEIFKFKLGDKLRDIVTGYEGICCARTQYLNGCIRYTLSRKLDKDGKVQDDHWFDEGVVMYIDSGIKIKQKDVGGPQTQKPPKGL